MNEPRVRSTNDRALILYDGACNLCAAWMRFAMARDAGGRIAFAPLQSETARRLLAPAGGPPPGTDSVIAFVGGTMLLRSAAALAVADRLRAPWPLLARLARVVPRGLRDFLYDRVARSRHRWFGRHDACALPVADGKDID